MVTYELESREGDVLIFRYWPEDDRQSKPGQFVVDLASETANLVEPAEGDFKCRTTGAEMNSMRDAINDMRAERGEPPLTEKELPTEPDDLVSEWWNYYDHAQRSLAEARYRRGSRTRSGDVVLSAIAGATVENRLLAWENTTFGLTPTNVNSLA